MALGGVPLDCHDVSFLFGFGVRKTGARCVF